MSDEITPIEPAPPVDGPPVEEPDLRVGDTLPVEPPTEK